MVEGDISVPGAGDVMAAGIAGRGRTGILTEVLISATYSSDWLAVPVVGFGMTFEDVAAACSSSVSQVALAAVVFCSSILHTVR